VSDKLKTVILSIGSELTNGAVQDVHGKYIADILNKTGITVRKILQVPDDLSVSSDIRDLADSADIMIITGGLGPTSDDITRELIAEAADVPLNFNETVWREIKNRFSAKINMTNRKQAYVPDGFTIISNSYGSAPGLKGKIGNALVYALPGPPSELKEMFQDYVLPELQSRAGVSIPDELTGTAFLISESVFEDILQKNSNNGVIWSTRVNSCRIVFSLKGGTRIYRESLFTELENIFNRIRIRRGEVELNNLLFETLKEAGKDVVFAESCTGGLCGKVLSDLPGSSEVFWGSIVTVFLKYIFKN